MTLESSEGGRRGASATRGLLSLRKDEGGGGPWLGSAGPGGEHPACGSRTTTQLLLSLLPPGALPRPPWAAASSVVLGSAEILSFTKPCIVNAIDFLLFIYL